MQAVCVILDVKPAKAKDEAGKQINDYWKPSVALLNEKDFLNKLKSYDKDNINPKLIERIRTGYLTNEGFTPENAKKASPAAEGMCKWVHAMSSYEKVSLPPPACTLCHTGCVPHNCIGACAKLQKVYHMYTIRQHSLSAKYVLWPTSRHCDVQECAQWQLSQ